MGNLYFLRYYFFDGPTTKADIISKLSSSIQLTVDASASQSTRIGSTYSVSGNNISMTLGGLTAPVDCNCSSNYVQEHIHKLPMEKQLLLRKHLFKAMQ